MSGLPLSFSANIQKGDGGQLCKSAGSGSGGNGDKGIITTAGCHGIKLIFPSLESLFHLFFQVFHGCPGSLFLFQFQRQIFIQMTLIGFFRIRLQQQIHAGHGKTAVLLSGCTEHNITDDVKGHIQCLGLVIPDITHFKSASEHFAHIEKAAVHGISSGRHIMDINITVMMGLNLFGCHEKFLIQFFIQLIKDQTSSGGNQG